MSLVCVTIFQNILWIIIASLCVAYANFKYACNYWSRKGVYSIPTVFPFGNAKDAVLQKKSIGEHFTEVYNKLKANGLHFGGYYTFFRPVLVLVDPDLIKSVISTDFSHFVDRSDKANDNVDPLSGHLLSLKGRKWKIMRQKLTPTFTSGKIKMMFSTILDCANKLGGILDEYVDNNEDFDVKEVIGRFTMDIIGSCAFGLDCNSMEDINSEFRQYAIKAVKPTNRRYIQTFFAKSFPKCFAFMNIKKTDDDISKFFLKLIQDTIEYREKNKIKRNDFLQLLINIRNTGDVDCMDKNGSVDGNKHKSGDGQGLTVEEIAGQSYFFFMAGFETPASATASFLYDMALHQEIQDKVRNEIKDILDKYDGKLTYDRIMELEYLDMALSECIRLHTTIPIIDRCCTQDYNIPNTDIVIEKGTIVLIPVHGLHSDPEYYPEPSKYDPERFSKEEMAKRHPFTYLPFGKGPRYCIARRFGMLQMKIALVALLRNYRFKIGTKTKIPLKMNRKSFICQVDGGVWLKAERV